jgi:hypothetical protein
MNRTDEGSAHWIVLFVLATAWMAAFAGYSHVLLGLRAAPPAIPAPNTWLAPIEAMRQAASFAPPAVWFYWLAPLILVTWIVLPSTDRSSVPFLVFLWMAAITAALSGAFGDSKTGLTTAAVIDALFALEGLRTAATAIVRKLGAPDDTENDWSRARPDRKRVLG